MQQFIIYFYLLSFLGAKRFYPFSDLISGSEASSLKGACLEKRKLSSSSLAEKEQLLRAPSSRGSSSKGPFAISSSRTFCFFCVLENSCLAFLRSLLSGRGSVAFLFSRVFLSRSIFCSKTSGWVSLFLWGSSCFLSYCLFIFLFFLFHNLVAFLFPRSWLISKCTCFLFISFFWIWPSIPKILFFFKLRTFGFNWSSSFFEWVS